MRPPVRLPAGVRDFLPRAAARRRAIAERLVALFESFGYLRIIPPVFECADVLERGLGDADRHDAIRFVEPGSGEVVALRPDFTPQVARLAATRLRDTGGPLRLCYEGAVHRLAGARGQRELLQAGIELIEPDAAGEAGAAGGDAEALAIAGAVLASILGGGVAEVRLDIGHVAPARAVLAAAAQHGEATEARLFEALARKDRPGAARVAAGLPEPWRTLAEALPRLWGPADEVRRAARALPWPPAVAAALDELDAALAAARDVIPAALRAQVSVDLGEVRGLQYYTGLRLAGFARGVGDAVLRGGRYDELMGRYGRPARAVGLAVDIEAIAQAQRAAEVAPPAPQLALVVAAPAERAAAAALAAALRAEGLRAAVDLAADDADAAGRLPYARAAGFSAVVALTAAAVTVHAVADGALVASLDVGVSPAELAARLVAESRRS